MGERTLTPDGGENKFRLTGPAVLGLRVSPFLVLKLKT